MFRRQLSFPGDIYFYLIMSDIFSRSTHLPTIAFFCLEHVFDKSLNLFVDFHVSAFTNGVETDNLFIFSLIYSSPEWMKIINLSLTKLNIT